MIEIRIFVDERPHGSRNWPQVPRVGELVEVQFHGASHDLRVTEVCWCYQSLAEFAEGSTRVNVFCVTEGA